MKKLSLLNINKEYLNKKELFKILGGAAQCDCTGPIYPSFPTEKNGMPFVCNCNDGSGDPGLYDCVYTGCY